MIKLPSEAVVNARSDALLAECNRLVVSVVADTKDITPRVDPADVILGWLIQKLAKMELLNEALVAKLALAMPPEELAASFKNVVQECLREETPRLVDAVKSALEITEH